MQAPSPAALKGRMRSRARLLVQGNDAASAAVQTKTGADAGRVAPRMQADRQSAVTVDARFGPIAEIGPPPITKSPAEVGRGPHLSRHDRHSMQADDTIPRGEVHK